MSFFVFSVLCYLTPHFAILTMQPVFLFQFLVDIYYARILWPCKHKCKIENSIGKDLERWHQKICVILENKSMRFLAFLLQFLGIVGFFVFIVVEANVRKEILFPAILLPVSIAVLSFVWSNWVQVYLAIPKSKEMCNIPFSARYKASEFYSRRVYKSISNAKWGVTCPHPITDIRLPL